MVEGGALTSRIEASRHRLLYMLSLSDRQLLSEVDPAARATAVNRSPILGAIESTYLLEEYFDVSGYDDPRYRSKGPVWGRPAAVLIAASKRVSSSSFNGAAATSF